MGRDKAKIQRNMIVLIVAAALLLFPATAQAHGQYSSTAEFLDSHILEPRGSVITGQMMVSAWRWYGIPVRSQIAILGAETALGTYPQGGRLVHENNFGCIKYTGNHSTPWGSIASGYVRVGGANWWTWPDRWTGIVAWGRYMKVGVGGAYQDMVFGAHPDWSRFANTYYGAGVPGIGHYVRNLRTIDRKYTGMARSHGFKW